MLRKAVFSVLIVLMACPVLKADEEAEKWVKFFVGDWTRKREIQKEGEAKQIETATWDYRLTAGGKAGVSEGKWDNGIEWVMIAGTGPGKFHFERGVNSDGIDWSIDYKRVDKNTVKGKSIGVAEGQKFVGWVKLEITGEDSYTATWEAKGEDGSITKAKAVNTRVKKAKH